MPLSMNTERLKNLWTRRKQATGLLAAAEAAGCLKPDEVRGGAVPLLNFLEFGREKLGNSMVFDDFFEVLLTIDGTCVS